MTWLNNKWMIEHFDLLRTYHLCDKEYFNKDKGSFYINEHMFIY